MTNRAQFDMLGHKIYALGIPSVSVIQRELVQRLSNNSPLARHLQVIVDLPVKGNRAEHEGSHNWP